MRLEPMFRAAAMETEPSDLMSVATKELRSFAAAIELSFICLPSITASYSLFVDELDYVARRKLIACMGADPMEGVADSHCGPSLGCSSAVVREIAITPGFSAVADVRNINAV